MKYELRQEALAHCLGIPHASLKTWRKRGTVELESAGPGRVKVNARQLVTLALAGALRRVVGQQAVRALINLVEDAWREADRTGFYPLLVAHLPSGVVRVFMALDPSALVPSEAEVIVDLTHAAEAFGRVLDRDGEPTRERVQEALGPWAGDLAQAGQRAAAALN